MSQARAKQEILKRIRGALGDAVAPGAPDRNYRRSGELSPAERMEQFESRLHDYNANVYRCLPSDLDSTIAQAMRDRGKTALVIPPGFVTSLDFPVDDSLSYDELDRSEGALTACTAAISFTGSIILTHSETEGRRALTLIPDYHLCVVRQSQLHETVPEGLAALQGRLRQPMTTIAGPSATADIEMIRVKGVHGPRTLDVILVCDS